MELDSRGAIVEDFDPEVAESSECLERGTLDSVDGDNIQVDNDPLESIGKSEVTSDTEAVGNVGMEVDCEDKVFGIFGDMGCVVQPGKVGGPGRVVELHGVQHPGRLEGHGG